MDEDQHEDRFGDALTEASDEDDRIVIASEEGSDEDVPDDDGNQDDDDEDRVVEAPKEQPDVRTIHGDDRITTPFMTDFEYAAAIGEIACRIEQGDLSLVSPKIKDICKRYNIDMALDIAEIALEDIETPLPLSIQRRMGPGVYEVWGIRELTLPSRVLCSGFDEESTRLLKEYMGDQETKMQILLRRNKVLKKF